MQSPGSTPRLAPAGDPPFVGRSELLAGLTAAWEQLPATGARLAALTGPAGIGKTRLARELEPHLIARGGQSLFAWCYEGGGAPPYWPWGALVRAYLRSAGQAAADAALEGCGEDLAKLVPEVRERLGERGSAPESLAAEHEFRFFYGMASFFRNIARVRPLLLLIDDVHWADASAVRLLAFLVRELRDAPVMVVVTLRDDGETQPSALQRVWGAVRGPASIALPVGPLGSSDVAKLVGARLGDDFDLGLIPALAERSEGNPLFLIELVRAVESAAVPAAADAIARLVPKAIQGVVLERLERLSPPCVALVRLAAVPCRELSLGQLRRAAGTDNRCGGRGGICKGHPGGPRRAARLPLLRARPDPGGRAQPARTRRAARPAPTLAPRAGARGGSRRGGGGARRACHGSRARRW